MQYEKNDFNTIKGCMHIYVCVWLAVAVAGRMEEQFSQYQSLNKQKHSISYLCFISSQVSCGLFSFLERYKELCTVFGMLCNCKAFILSDFGWLRCKHYC